MPATGIFSLAFLWLSVSVLAQSPELVLPLGHSFRINAADFSPDGKYVITASEDRTTRLWRVLDGRLLKELHEPESIMVAKFSPACPTDPGGGKYILTASEDNRVRVWETRTGKLVHLLNGLTHHEALGNGGISNLADFSPDGKYIAVVSDATLDLGELRIWNAGTGKLFRRFRTGARMAYYPAFNRESTTVTVDINDSTTKTWKLADGKLIRQQKHEGEIPDSSDFSSDGKLELEINEEKKTPEESTYSVSIKDSYTNNLISTLDAVFEEGSYPYPQFSPDARYVITLDDNIARIWETATGKLFRTLTGHADKPEASFFSRDGKYIIAYPDSNPEEQQVGQVWDLLTAKTIDNDKVKPYRIVTSFNSFEEGSPMMITWNDSITKSIPRKGAFTKSYGEVFEISSDLKYIVNAQGISESPVYLWDGETGKLLKTLQGHTGVIHTVHFSPDNKFILTAASDNTAKIWQTQTGKLLRDLPGHTFMVQSAEFNPPCVADPKGGKYIVTTAGDHLIRVWETNTGKLLVTFLGLENNGYLSSLPSGYYQCTPDAAKLLHYVTRDLKVITFEQLDLKYNRPDKILEAVGNTDTALIKSYHKAWEKRIKKMGIDTAAFRDGYSVPEADFINRESVAYDQKIGTLRLEIKGVDSIYKLDRFNLWVNEVPVYGQRGIKIRERNKNEFDTTLTIKLSPGENHLETSITNVNGTESYRMPLIVNYIPAVQIKETARFIGIGIDQFADQDYNLQYSVKDIRDLADSLQRKYKDNIIIDTLFNTSVTVSNIKALKQKLQQTTENDKVIIAYSGHGMLSKEYDYYLSTYAVNFQQPEEKGLPYDELENLLDSIPARKKLLLIDACNSGEVDKEELVGMQRVQQKLDPGKKGVIVVIDSTNKRLGTKNSFELMQSLFVNVGKSTGATIISAAAGTQFALERNDLKNGVFTYSILEAMKNYPGMMISELKKIIGKRVVELTDGLQKPTSRNETITADWSIW